MTHSYDIIIPFKGSTLSLAVYARRIRVWGARMEDVVCCNLTRMRDPSAVRSTKSRRSQQFASAKETVGGVRMSGVR